MPEIMPLVWLPEALDDLDRLIRFLEDAYPPAATRAAQAVLGAANELRSNPELGRCLDKSDCPRREWYAPFGVSAYVLRYRVANNTIVILRIWHAREAREPLGE